MSWKTCASHKVVYRSRKKAEQAAIRLRMLKGGDRGLKPYRCWACGEWHIGHLRGGGRRQLLWV